MEHSLAKVIFRLTKPLKLIRGWFPKRSTNFYSVLLSENSPVPITIFCIVCFEAVARVLYDVSNNVRTPQELDFRLITTSKKMTLVKFTCLLANALSSLSHYFLLTPVNLTEYTWCKQSWIEKLWVERGKRSLPSAFLGLYLWSQYLLSLWWNSKEDNFKKYRHP